MEEFIKLVANQLNADEKDISLDMELIGDIGLDSLGLIDLISELTDHYGIEFDSRAVQRFITLKDIYDFVCNKG